MFPAIIKHLQAIVMIKKRLFVFTVLVFSLAVFLTGCGEENRDNQETIRILEKNIKDLEEVAKITTFPLTIIISDKMHGTSLPESMQILCNLSKNTCKTLPIAGILRLGSNNYYEYNCISTLSVPESINNNEADATDTIQRQVASYLSGVKLRDFDSLLSPNHPAWDIQNMSLDYITNSADSIYFFSETPIISNTVQVGDKTFMVYYDIRELRKKIDAIICENQKTISVFYNPAPLGSVVSTPADIKSSFPETGIRAGDTCVNFDKYERLHDGSGGYMPGNLIEANSKSCGFRFPTGLAGDTCLKGSRYEKSHNGKGGFAVGNLIERNSKSCGFVIPAGPAGDTCISGSRYQKLHTGEGGFSVGRLVEKNSRSCGFVYPTGPATDTCINGSRFQKFHNGRGGFTTGKLIEKNSKSCGFNYPAAGSAASGFICEKGSKYARVNDGKGGFARGALLEVNSRSCGFVYPTGIAGDTCISGSKYQKLHNGRGGFAAGRMIERNSKSCGFNYPGRGTAASGFICEKGSKYVRLNDGNGGFTRGALIERNSKGCGFAYPTGLAGDTCINGSKYQKLYNGRGGFSAGKLLERNSTACGFRYPAAGTAATGFMCEGGSRYARVNDGKGGFSRGALIEANSKQCAVATPSIPDNVCAEKSDAICEKDTTGNYTGRRVQYCYNKSGRIIRTIVISKCDEDCRCLGN